MNELKERVLQVLEKHGVAVTRGELEVGLGLREGDPQALLRVLRGLEREGAVAFEGNTRARRYRLVSKPVTAPVPEVPLSPEASEALRRVEVPVGQRPPVTYARAFLDGYVPGRSAWLSAAQRERLHGLGRTPAEHQVAGTWARHVLERFLLDLSWNSARLEGNTYSLLDTERLLRAGTTAEGKDAVETQMLLNHKAAIEFLVGEPGSAALEPRTVQTLHALLMENLLGNRLDEGRLRVVPVSIGGSAYLPMANPQVLEECFRQLVLTAQRIDDPFEASLFLLAQLPYLQPFLDGNKRTARLAANVPFVTENLVPLSFVDVPRELFTRAYLALYELQHIEPLRDVFLWAYERSAVRLGQVRASLAEPDPFRLEHRGVLRDAVAAVVRARLVGPAAVSHLERFAAVRLPEPARLRFLSMAQLELEALHDGNFGRYGLRPSEFEAWRAEGVHGPAIFAGS